MVTQEGTTITIPAHEAMLSSGEGHSVTMVSADGTEGQVLAHICFRINIYKTYIIKFFKVVILLQKKILICIYVHSNELSAQPTCAMSFLSSLFVDLFFNFFYLFCRWLLWHRIYLCSRLRMGSWCMSSSGRWYPPAHTQLLCWLPLMAHTLLYR